MKRQILSSIVRRTASAALGLAMATPTLVQAAATDISQNPLLTAKGTPVKPNLMFILDDSGSMSSNYLPEDANMVRSRYAERSSQCNGLAFNPLLAYAPPVNADKSSAADASIASVMNADTDLDNKRVLSSAGALTPVASGALQLTLPSSPTPKSSWYPVGNVVTVYDSSSPTRWMVATVTGWNTSTRKLDLNVLASSGTTALVTPYIGDGTPQFAYYKYSGAQPALGYSYDSAGTVNKTTTFYKECASTVGATPGSGVFTLTVVTSASADAQKLANWWAYYSTRMKMMKTVVSQAFKDIDDSFRVGFNTILNKTVVESSGSTAFLNVRDFDETQKSKFYTDLNAATPSGYTPLRASLSNAGRYYANKGPSQNYDPVQYSCQRNFVILATDGAWNTNAESSTYGPFRLDGVTKVGQQDGTAARPMRDANGVIGTGSSDALADVSMYFYSTDLRDATLSNCTGALGIDVCANNVSALGKDTANWQHLSTYTLSLGQNGTLKYASNYETQTSGDFYDLTQGTKQWPNPANGLGAANVDDLWHAAVNGRGSYFNAADPAAVGQSLKNALSAIAQINASGSAAATSTLRPVAGNNQVFVARYTSALWIGDVRSYKIDTETGSPIVRDVAGNDIADWSAADQLRAKDVASRKIYYYKPGTGLREFTYANLSADGYSGDFDNACSKSPALSQCPSLSSADKTAANSGANLVSYLRGSEQSYYRTRVDAKGHVTVLGDMIGSSPVYVGAPPLKYKDAGYAAYQSANASRAGVVFVGSNDGMLHAFSASTGNELWAYVPSMVRSNMVKLADFAYGSNHQFFVDGSPVVADVEIGGSWKTILVGGLGAGGKGYYALDVTDPASPVALWEFTDANLGLSYGTPVVTKRASGEWVVAVSSGYNNMGDGKGHLFLLRAKDGAKLVDISTTAGDAGTPSGLGPVNAWIDSMDDNSAKRFYAGDLQGNIWRFDTEGLTAPTNAALQLAQLRVGGKAQPITTQPQLAEINYKGFKSAVVYVGTGQLLGLTDLSNTDKQTVYGIKDDLGASGLGDVRAGTSLVQQTLTTDGTTRTASGNPVDWSVTSGWYVDLPDAGERINVDMLLQFNTLTAASNVPQSVASCTEGGGYSWLYYFDIANGSNTGKNVATKISDSVVVGLSSFLLGNGKNGVIINKSLKDPEAKIVPTPPVSGTNSRRTSWRELVDR